MVVPLQGGTAGPLRAHGGQQVTHSSPIAAAAGTAPCPQRQDTISGFQGVGAVSRTPKGSSRLYGHAEQGLRARRFPRPAPARPGPAEGSGSAPPTAPAWRSGGDPQGAERDPHRQEPEPLGSRRTESDPPHGAELGSALPRRAPAAPTRGRAGALRGSEPTRCPPCGAPL